MEMCHSLVVDFWCLSMFLELLYQHARLLIRAKWSNQLLAELYRTRRLRLLFWRTSTAARRVLGDAPQLGLTVTNTVSDGTHALETAIIGLPAEIQAEMKGLVKEGRLEPIAVVRYC